MKFAVYEQNRPNQTRGRMCFVVRWDVTWWCGEWSVWSVALWDVVRRARLHAVS